MTSRKLLLKSATALVALTLAAPTVALADDQIKVVATFSILGDMVDEVGGDNIDLTTIVGPNGDTHVYQPTPQDARAVAQADVLFINGLEFEGWLERLVEASGFDGKLVVATNGIDAIPFAEEDGHDDHSDEHDDHDDHDGHDHAEFDPHAWHSIDNALIYVSNITAALSAADAENAAAYEAARAAYAAELTALDAEIDTLMAALPEDDRTVVTAHDAFGYLAATYNMNFVAPVGMSTESEASAADVAALITQIREEGVDAVFVEAITDNRLLEQIANETGAGIGGTLYSDALSDENGPASTYVDMMRHNATTIANALGS